jgi:hypothetical protein
MSKHSDLTTINDQPQSQSYFIIYSFSLELFCVKFANRYLGIRYGIKIAGECSIVLFTYLFLELTILPQPPDCWDYHAWHHACFKSSIINFIRVFNKINGP